MRAFKPLPSEILLQLGDLVQALGIDGTARCLGVYASVICRWIAGGRVPCGPSSKLIWITWALLLHPEVITTVHDVMTWGQFRTTQKRTRLSYRRPPRPAKPLPDVQKQLPEPIKRAA